MPNVTKTIENLYEMEEFVNHEDQQTTKITVKVPVETATMFNAIAARFGASRFSLIEPILKEAAEDMFHALNEEDRKNLSKAADNETTEIMSKIGITQTSVGIAGNYENECSHWREIDALRAHLEAKREESSK